MMALCRYEGQMHSTHGYLVLVLAFALSAIDAFSGLGRVISYVRSTERDGQCSVRSFWNRVILSQGCDHVHGTNNNAEYTSLALEEVEELNEFPKAHAYHHHRYVASLAGLARNACVRPHLHWLPILTGLPTLGRYLSGQRLRCQGHSTFASPWSTAVWDFAAAPGLRGLCSIDAWNCHLYRRLPGEFLEWVPSPHYQ